jgi:hypothetical protein
MPLCGDVADQVTSGWIHDYFVGIVTNSQDSRTALHFFVLFNGSADD